MLQPSTFVLCGSVAADYSMVKRDLDIVGSILYLSSLVVVSVAAVVVQI